MQGKQTVEHLYGSAESQCLSLSDWDNFTKALFLPDMITWETSLTHFCLNRGPMEGFESG